MANLSGHVPTKAGSAKAVSRISQPGTALSGYNISSLTDVGTGINDHNFAAPMANADYSVEVSVAIASSSSTIFRVTSLYNLTSSGTGSVRTESGVASGASTSFQDRDVSVIVHGDLA